jgi:putative transposase
MLLCVRWYIAYPLSLRNLEEMMQERRPVRRSFHDSPLDRQAGSGAGGSLFANESANEASVRSAKAGDWTRRTSRFAARTGIGIARSDKQGNTFLLTAKRDRRAAQRFFTRAVKNNRLPNFLLALLGQKVA